ncbi:hypothetical protein L218DRAFT_982792 [Marasmius fiardii PR-910]|nr:hypothetical protein L218DRAFT_982792 [Marasmius fiardii PR-910]
MSSPAPLLTITRLPTEILLYIFTWGNEIEVDDASRDFDSFMEPFFPKFCVKIAVVCRAWRNLVLTSPRLWTNIVINIHNIERAKLFLERSYPCPIALQVYGNLLPHDIISATVPHSSRLRSLTIRAGSPQEAALYSNVSPLPCLEELCVMVRSWETTDPEWDESLLNLIRNSTALRSATFKGILPLNFETVPWENLSFLNVKQFRPTYEQLRSLFNRAPRLDTLYLSTFLFPSEDQPQVLPAIEAPSLKDLRISFGPLHHTQCSCPLSLLSVANLETLTVIGNEDESTSLSKHFSDSRASNSFTKLSQMRLVSIILTTDDVHFFRNLNNLRRLELEEIEGELSLCISEPFEGTKPLPLMDSIAFFPIRREELGWLEKRRAIQTSQLSVELPRDLYNDPLDTSFSPPLTCRLVEHASLPPYFPRDSNDPWDWGITEDNFLEQYSNDGFEDHDDYEDYTDYEYHEDFSDEFEDEFEDFDEDPRVAFW